MRRIKILPLLVLAALIVALSCKAKKTEAIDESNQHKTNICTCYPDFSAIVEKVTPAVVNIFTTQEVEVPYPFPEEIFKYFFGEDFSGIPKRSYKKRSLGSGFIITSDGYIVTNNHVIEKATEIKVILKDGTEYTAKVIGKDKLTDLALIKINPQNPLPTVELGDSDKLKIGEWVIAIGNPLGLSYTVTAGIVSGKGRFLNESPYDNFIQTDASINPGNSGGPLVNMEGKVVGINTAIIPYAQGIGFAIPINQAKFVIDQLMKKGKVVRGYLGIYIQEITPELGKSLNLPVTKGVIVARVEKDSPADKAGLKAGDVILEFNGKKIEHINDLTVAVSTTPPGSVVEVKILRGNTEKVITAKVGEIKDRNISSKDEIRIERLGISVSDVPFEIKAQSNIEGGAIITRVEPGSIAHLSGMEVGDIIVKVNNINIESARALSEIIKRLPKNSYVTFLIYKERGAKYITIQIK